jgi:hypothetical protein
MCAACAVRAHHRPVEPIEEVAARGLRALSAALSLTVVSAGVAAVAWRGTPTAHAEASAPAELPDDASAARAAARFHTPVEVSSRRSSTVRVFANPDGTATVEESAVPVRVRQADGSWVPVDLTLTRWADGAVAPGATVTPVTLSGGGTGAFATVHAGAEHYSLSWPTALPAPTLSGDTATYADVLPGVDLRVRVDRYGFSEVLVVKSAAAARNPALTKVRFGTAGPAGSAFHIGAPLMWDSTPASGADPGTGDVPDSDASRPGRSARRAPMAMQVTSRELAIVPDAVLLTAPGLHYPLYLDPSVSVGGTWTMINQRFPDQSYWSYDRNSHAKVGYSTDPNVGWVRYRSIWQFDTAPWRGRHVLGAKFSADLIHSWSCTDSQTELHLTATVNSGTTWNNHAGSWGSSLANISNSSCDDVRKYTEWSGTLTSVVQQSTDWSTVTLGLRATDEGSTNGWKKFDENTAKLSVTFNSYPNTPDTLTIDGKPCGTGAGKAYVSTLGGHNPVLSARVSDPDSGDHLTGTFTWSTGSGNATGFQSNVANGATAQVTTNGTAFTSGATYSFQATAGDGTDTSPAAGPCEFFVDSTAPDKPPVVTSTDGRYPADDGLSGWHDGVGRGGTFTLAANGVSDVVAYRYGLVDPPATDVAAPSAGGSATVTLVPSKPGLNTLFVRSIDRVGDLSAVTQYRFYVASGAPEVGLWRLDEGSGTTAADLGTGQHPLTLASGTGWTGGRLVGSNAATFNGTSGSASTTGPVVHTDQSFSIAAWVRLTQAPTDTNYPTVLAQSGARYDAFELEARPGVWCVNTRPSPTTYGLPAGACGGPIALGVWTHLAAVYDAAGPVLRLYVNGVQVNQLTHTMTWDATGPAYVGTKLFNGAWEDFWAGDIADVHMWDRVVFPDEIAAMSVPTLAGAWDLDEGGGTTAFDNTVYQRDATLSGNAHWTASGHTADDFGALTFDGTAGWASTAGPAVRSDQSFSVSAWVRLTQAPTDSYYPSVVSQAGPSYDGFELEARPGVWCINTRPSPTTYGYPTGVCGGTIALGVWTHLAAVYDAGAGTIRLYVNGSQVGQVSYRTTWNAAGPVYVGTKWFSGTTGGYWTGDIDAVRVYAGVLSPTDVGTLYNS